MMLSSSSISRKEYGVFLSFRGKDTRKKFTDHFYYNLEDSGIVTFRDKERLKTGKDIASGLLKAIRQSSSAVIILSENFASSAWCLKELAEIVKQEEERGLKVFPIFYHVNPSVFRRQTKKVGEAFAKHEKKYNEETIQKWRNALTQVANMSGCHLNDEYESEFIRDKVRRISAELCQTYPIIIHDGLVGIRSRLEELKSKLQIGEDDVRIIGICGMGGIGKTTLAIVVYNQMSPHFQGKCFIANVREVSERCGLVSLQKQLLSQILNKGFQFFNDHEGKAIISHRLSHKKVLIVLDDVDKLQQLECLVGRRDWFGLGSRIIVTTRDERLLLSHRVDDVYKAETLNDDDALQLFLLKAFDGGTVPNDDLMELSRCVVGYAGGLPLALKVLGSFFGSIDAAAKWRSALERLERDSNKDIIDILRISFDVLEESLKDIFLDLACFFGISENRNFIRQILDGCEFSAGIGIDDLVKKSLLDYVGEDGGGVIIWKMHDLLREMGRKIVRDESKEPGERSRLWDTKDVDHALMQNTATDNIECIYIPYRCIHREYNERLNLSMDAFSKMKNLRLLRIHCLTVCDHLNYLPNELRLLDWDYCPLRSLPSSFQPHKLVALSLQYNAMERLWEGTIPMYELKQIKLTWSVNLIEIPDFTKAPNLEILILKGCRNLIGLPSSIGGCKSLKTLNLFGCHKIENLPENLQQAELLEELDLSETAITKPQSFIFQFKNLKLFTFNGCKGSSQNMASLSLGMTNSMALMLQSFSGLRSLTRLELRDHNLGEGDIPTDIGCLSSLEFLVLSGNHFISLPPSLTRLSKLYSVDLSNCIELKSLPEFLITIARLNIDGCSSLELIAIPSKVCSNSTVLGRFSGVNCHRLVENMNAVTLLKENLKVFANSRMKFDMIIPGSEIPEWFSGQERVESSSIKIPLPLNSRNDSQWMGVAIFCIFVSGVWSASPDVVDFEAFAYCRNSVQAGSYDGKFRVDSGRHTVGPIIKDHIFLRYLSRDDLLTPDWFNQEWDELEFSFEQDWSGRVKVKQCGFRMVYQKDLEDVQLIEEQQQYKNQGFAEFEDNIEDGSIATGSHGKRKRNVS